MSHQSDQRFLPTDPISQFQHFLWTLGISDSVDRQLIVARVEQMIRDAVKKAADQKQ